MPIDQQLLQLFEEAMLDSGWGRRLTQDSPILPDVWVAYAKDPLERHDLLLTPHWGTNAGELAKQLSDRLAAERDTEIWKSGWASADQASPRIAYTNTTVAVRLRFDELIRVILPMTQWWEKYLWEDAGDEEASEQESSQKSSEHTTSEAADQDPNPQRPKGGVGELLSRDGVVDWVAEFLVDAQLLRSAFGKSYEGFPKVTPDLLWMTRLVGLIAVRGRRLRASHNHQEPTDDPFREFLAPQFGDEIPAEGQDPQELQERRLEAARQMVEATRELVLGMDEAREEDAAVWMVNRNRSAEACIFDSALAVKADAARRLFDINCSEITWAVIDSGIDATHPSFAERDPRKGHRPPKPYKMKRKRGADAVSAKQIAERAAEEGREPPSVPFRFEPRVKATYDFSLVRYLLSPNTEALDEDIEALRAEIQNHPQSPRSHALMSRLLSLKGLRNLLDPEDDATVAERKQSLTSDLEAYSRATPQQRSPQLQKFYQQKQQELESAADRKTLRATAEEPKRQKKTKELRESLQRGRAVDWGELKRYLEIPHDQRYRIPEHNHGTHVAGILGGEWLRTDEELEGFASPVEGPGDQELVGVAPDIQLYDLRVLGDDGSGDEFSVIAALQFVRFLNENSEMMVVQGANLSLSIRHAVSNYACGRTPVCEESERLVNNGVMVVAAGGNGGYLKLRTSDGEISEGYSTVSITDPGNAEQVLTVGATHRAFPHAYGVSYFSSRGPTGDGRQKPDLVAPGEKITAPVPKSQWARLDGTSMAAPHASGAAALLMARHRELLGEPARIKEILCATATDLGRERYFQGAGMLDALRALQSV